MKIMKKIYLLVAMALALMLAPSVGATATGTIRIDPAWPIMEESPADFTIWTQGEGDPTCDPHVLLVMTQACWDGLTGDVVVTWSGGSVPFAKGDFTPVTTNSEYVPDSGTTEGGRYTVASLKDHLSYGLTVPLTSEDTIYWAMDDFLSGDITGTPQAFTVTLDSSYPRMLVYAIGKTCGEGLFDRKVPPTIPGFIVPEVGPALMALASLSAFAIYAVKRRKVHP